ncbi:MAG: amidase [Gemmatimonadetes bacterium]|nr:amidase [Gemmatimonadota bacterium]MCC6772560.1 amidase [Gemmatimonadaceae bacterium]
MSPVPDALALAALVRSRLATPRELVDAAIARIEQLNPALNAVVHTMFEQARREADAPPAHPDGVFCGIPFLIKDLLTAYAGEPMGNGSRLYDGWRPDHDSEVMRRYRKAGVIVLGKTNTPEFGLAPFTEPRSKGIARNPWNTDRTTGGSSGGSAAAVASGMVPMAGGGDGGGSIRIPASCCGIFGFKATRGRVPTGPDEGELWAGAVTEGVLTRSVRDSAAMLDALHGEDVGAPYAAPRRDRPFLDEVTTEPGRLRIAFTDAPMLGHAIHPDCSAAVHDAARLLESLGHDVEQRAPAIDREAFNRAFITIVCGEVLADLRDAASRIGREATRADVEVATWGLATLGGAISAGDYAEAQRYLQRTARDIARFFTDVDVFLTPTLGAPPVPHGTLQPTQKEELLLTVLGALGAGGIMKRFGAIEDAAATVFDFTPYPPLFNVTGQPAMSVPLFWNAEGLPVGVQLAARFGDDATLFRLAGALERTRPWAERWPTVSVRSS